MDGLSDELVVRILSSHLALHDLLHMSRVSRRFRDLIQAAETLWESSAEGCSFDAGLKNDDQTWRHFFKAQFIMQRRKMQQRHRLKVLNAQGELEAVQKELDSHRQLLKKELATERRLEEELAAARRVLTAQSASQVWAPTAVRRFHSHIVEQASVSRAARVEQARSELQLAALQIKQHVNCIRSNKQKLKEAKRKLKQLRP